MPILSETSPAVFISYASQDAAVATALVEALERHGIVCWIAPRNVKAGAMYADAIVRAISAAKAFVLVLSESAIASSHVSKEIERASSKRRPIISLRIDVAPLTPALEYFLSESQWIEAQAGNMDAAYVKLIEAIRESACAAPEGVVAGVPGNSAGTSSAVHPRSRRNWILFAAGLAVVVVVFAAMLSPRFWPVRHTTAGPATTVVSDKSIAVLPFVDMSEKHDQEYFADGMAEEVLDLLANIPGLKVIGRTSSFQFKGKNQDLRTIGNALGVSYVVEGSVRNSNEGLRVTAQLINAQDGSHLWSETFERPPGDALKVQDQIAFNLARALQLSVGADSPQPRPSFKSPEAYDLYLRGRHAYEKGDREGFEAAAAYFQEILDLDPTSVPGQEYLAAVQADSAQFSYVAPHEGFEVARRSVQRALALDPKSCLAHATLSEVHLLYDWDWAAAELEAKEAIRLKPRNTAAIAGLASVYGTLGRWDEAARLFETALTLDPLDAGLYQGLSLMQIANGRLSEAETAARKTLQITPTFGEGHLTLGEILLLEGNFQSALAEMQQEPWARNIGLAMVYHALGRRSESDAALAQAVSEHAQNDAYEIADVFAYRVEVDQAFAWLDRAYSQKDATLYEVKFDPFLKNLKGDPRYNAFLRKMNLPE
jgi:TolB-like protein/Flp pilus assembly protein TadD